MSVIRTSDKKSKSSKKCSPFVRLSKVVDERNLSCLPPSYRALIPVREPSWAVGHIASIFAERLNIQNRRIKDNQKLDAYIKSFGWGPYSSTVFRQFQARLFDNKLKRRSEGNLSRIFYGFWRLLNEDEQEKWKTLGREYRALYSEFEQHFPPNKGQSFQARIQLFRNRADIIIKKAERLEQAYATRAKANDKMVSGK
ncbi:hypothetical protein CPB86DRAFT_802048 [Serendipita vermifera]|nr:hypothetical protein CPB86DRAFT_802048 [Serendipita vermifera]